MLTIVLMVQRYVDFFTYAIPLRSFSEFLLRLNLDSSSDRHGIA